MSLPSMHGMGRLTAEPELRFAKSGTAVCTVPLAFNARRYDKERGEWVDGDVFFIRGTVFGDAAENASESYGRGDEVVVFGRLKTDQWQDRNTGEKRSATSMLIDAIGPSTRSGKAQVAKSKLPDAGSSWPETTRPPAPAGSSDEPPF